MVYIINAFLHSRSFLKRERTGLWAIFSLLYSVILRIVKLQKSLYIVSFEFQPQKRMFTLNRNSINCNLSLLFPLITLDSHFLDYISHRPLSHSSSEPGLWFLQPKLIPGRLCGPGSLTIVLGASEEFIMCVCVKLIYAHTCVHVC